MVAEAPGVRGQGQGARGGFDLGGGVRLRHGDRGRGRLLREPDPGDSGRRQGRDQAHQGGYNTILCYPL